MDNKKTIKRVQDTYAAHAGDPHRSERELKKLVREGKKSGDLFLLGCAYRTLAVVYAQLGSRDDILSCAARAVALLKDSGEHETVAKAYGTLGYAYFTQEDFQMALANYDRAYQILKRHRIRSINTPGMLNNIATCYGLMGDYKTCAKLLNDCVKQTRAQTPDDYRNMAAYCVNLADCYVRMGETKAAEDILVPMDDWADRSGIPSLICDYHLRYAVVLYRLENRAEGNRRVDTVLDMIERNDDTKDLFDVYALYDDLRSILHTLVENRDRERAERIVRLMENYAEKKTDTMDQLLACRAILDYYGGFGEYERAASYYARLDELYEKRMDELKSIQLNIHRMIRDADAEMRKMNAKIRESEENLSREPLTGLLNRAALLRVSSEFIDIAAKKKERVGAIFIDIDFFKECNDTYGHARGDEIIREIARVCQKEDKANVCFARYGGDEFFGIAHGLENGELAEIAKRIAARIRNADIPNEKNPNGHRVTLSVGLANVPVTERTNTIIDIANYADKAVYHAKNTGKNAIYMLDYNREDTTESNAIFVRIDF